LESFVRVLQSTGTQFEDVTTKSNNHSSIPASTGEIQAILLLNLEKKFIFVNMLLCV